MSARSYPADTDHVMVCPAVRGWVLIRARVAVAPTTATHGALVEGSARQGSFPHQGTHRSDPAADQIRLIVRP